MKKEERITFENCLDIMTIKEVASLLTVSERMVNKLVSDDRIKSFRIGRARRFTKNPVKDSSSSRATTDPSSASGKRSQKKRKSPFRSPMRG